MLSVFPSDVLFNEILKHAILSITTGFFWLGFVLLALRFFKIENAAVKYALYVLVLLKSFTALLRDQPVLAKSKGLISLMVQIPNGASNVVPDLWDMGNKYAKTDSFFAIGPGAAVLLGVLIFFGWRFLAFIRFQKLILTAPEVQRDNYPELFAILDKLVAKAKVSYPKVICVDSGDTPFTVGLKRPIIAFSPPLLDMLNGDEIEAILAHEIAHIVRKDHLLHWPIVIMRDILFFNPLTYVVFRRIGLEREKACDDFSAGMCDPLTLAKSLIRVVEINKEVRDVQPLSSFAPQSFAEQRRQPQSVPNKAPVVVTDKEIKLMKSFAPQSFLGKRRQSSFSLRIDALLVPKTFAPLAGCRRISFWAGFIFFAIFEVHVGILMHGSRVLLF